MNFGKCCIKQSLREHMTNSLGLSIACVRVCVCVELTFNVIYTGGLMHAWPYSTKILILLHATSYIHTHVVISTAAINITLMSG